MNNSRDAENYLIALVASCRASASQIPLGAIDFIDGTNREIWLCAEQLESEGQPANILTISDRLKTKGIPSPLQTWTDSLNIAINDYRNIKNDKLSINNAVSKIKKDAIDLKVKTIANDLITNPSTAGNAIQLLLEATSETVGRTSTTLQDGVKKAVDQFQIMSENPTATGSLTGLSDIDEETGGFQKTDFIVVGARSAMGKTAFALSCMQNAVKDGRYSGIISVEMPDVQLGMRHIVSKSGVDIKKIRTGKATETEWAQIGQALKSTTNEERRRILINDWTNDWDVIKTQIRTWASNYDMSGGIWIDYLQNLRVVRNGRMLEKVQEAMIISYECKALAKELNIPIIGLSQLQRTIDSQRDKRPTKANLSWASQFENDADLIMLIYRHEVYEPEFQAGHGVAEIIIDKFRNGQTSTQIVCFRGSRTDFVDIEETAKHNYINALNNENQTNTKQVQY